MTEFTDSVHILDNNTDDPTINYMCCMARKADKTQCTHTKKIGEYCGMHYNKSNIIRIDEPIMNKPKRVYIKKTRIINKTIKSNRNVNSVITIQSWFRGCLVRMANRLRGPGFYNPSLCNNTEDIYLFEDINKIHPDDIFTMKDKDGFIYGFHIESIYKYVDINRDKENITNPYNKTVIPYETIMTIEKLYRYCKIIGFHNKIQNILPIDPKFLLRNKVIRVFQKMDELNNYTDIEWFMNLTNMELIKLIYGIKDLFDYRLELTNTKKRQIIKSGVVFYKDNNYYKYQPFDKLREEIIDEFDKLVSEGETKDERYLGSLIILSGLVERDNNCATAYPWLLQGSFN
jgi:hypothetical protein